jgi:hypothetical protein
MDEVLLLALHNLATSSHQLNLFYFNAYVMYRKKRCIVLYIAV